MAFTKETSQDTTVHWADEGEGEAVCGRAVAHVIRGAGVTSLIEGRNAKYACGRCGRSLRARLKAAESSLDAFTRLAGED